MNQKGFANITLLGIIIVIIVGLVGYFSFRQKSAVNQGVSPIQSLDSVTNCEKITPPSAGQKSNPPTNASTRGPLDTAWAVITVLSVKGEIAHVQIEEICNYFRHPKATYPELQTGDKINTRVYSMAFPSNDTVDGRAERGQREGEQTTPILSPKPEVGRKYLADMSYCITEYIGELSCEYEGWSSALYPY